MLHSLKLTAKAPENRPGPTPHREIHVRLTSLSWKSNFRGSKRVASTNGSRFFQPLPDISRKKHVFNPPKTIMDIKKTWFPSSESPFFQGFTFRCHVNVQGCCFLAGLRTWGGVFHFLVKNFSSELYGVYLPKHY